MEEIFSKETIDAVIHFAGLKGGWGIRGKAVGILS